jgi:hypothetical protein
MTAAGQLADVGRQAVLCPPVSQPWVSVTTRLLLPLWQARFVAAVTELNVGQKLCRSLSLSANYSSVIGDAIICGSSRFMSARLQNVEMPV